MGGTGLEPVTPSGHLRTTEARAVIDSLSSEEKEGKRNRWRIAQARARAKKKIAALEVELKHARGTRRKLLLEERDRLVDERDRLRESP
jgi:hypothetical protein